jgi:hypothetical protein
MPALDHYLEPIRIKHKLTKKAICRMLGINYVSYTNLKHTQPKTVRNKEVMLKAIKALDNKLSNQPPDSPKHFWRTFLNDWSVRPITSMLGRRELNALAANTLLLASCAKIVNMLEEGLPAGYILRTDLRTNMDHTKGVVLSIYTRGSKLTHKSLLIRFARRRLLVQYSTYDTDTGMELERILEAPLSENVTLEILKTFTKAVKKEIAQHKKEGKRQDALMRASIERKKADFQ